MVNRNVKAGIIVTALAAAGAGVMAILHGSHSATNGTTVPGVGTLIAPTNLVAQVTGYQAGMAITHFAWVQVPGAAGYELTIMDAAGNKVQGGQLTGTAADIPLPVNSALHWQVRAFA